MHTPKVKPFSLYYNFFFCYQNNYLYKNRPKRKVLFENDVRYLPTALSVFVRTFCWCLSRTLGAAAIWTNFQFINCCVYTVQTERSNTPWLDLMGGQLLLAKKKILPFLIRRVWSKKKKINRDAKMRKTVAHDFNNIVDRCSNQFPNFRTFTIVFIVLQIIFISLVSVQSAPR